MTTAEFQTLILDETGIKTSVKQGKGSNKDYIIFSPMFQNGIYPEYPFQWRRELTGKYQDTEPPLIFTSGTQIQLHKTVIKGEPIQYKKERKPEPIDPNKPTKGWGSKNSQMRLDKTAARYAAKRLRPGGDNMVKYW